MVRLTVCLFAQESYGRQRRIHNHHILKLFVMCGARSQVPNPISIQDSRFVIQLLVKALLPSDRNSVLLA